MLACESEAAELRSGSGAERDEAGRKRGRGDGAAGGVDGICERVGNGGETVGRRGSEGRRVSSRACAHASTVARLRGRSPPGVQESAERRGDFGDGASFGEAHARAVDGADQGGDPGRTMKRYGHEKRLKTRVRID